MAYTFRWQIARVDGFQQHPELTLENVIAEVYWELEVRDSSDGSVHYVRAMTKLPDPTPDDFTDYLEIDHTDVLQWVWNIEGGREKMEKQARAELDAMRAPNTTQLQTLPQHWQADCCPDGKNIDLKGSVTTVSD